MPSEDVRLCSSIFHTLRLRMETAGAVTVSSSAAWKHSNAKVSCTLFIGFRKVM